MDDTSESSRSWDGGPPSVTQSDFAEELDGRPGQSLFFESYRGDPPSRILWRSRELAVLADYAPLVAGHVIIIPVEYVASFADASPEAQDQATQLVSGLASIFGKVYGDDFAFFEHGSAFALPVRSACVLHAHLHVLPLHFDFTNDLQQRGARIEEAAGLKHALNQAPKANPYFLWGNTSEARFARLTAQSNVQRQYAREVIAGQLGIDAWDWNAFPMKPLLRQTVTELSVPLSTFRTT